MTKVLLVDDHAIMIDGLKSMLSTRTDLNVTATASSAGFALAYLAQDHVDLMITDYSMPDIDGLELVKRAKSQFPDLKIIMLSMHDEPAIINAVMKAGLDAYILKKYALEELSHAIDAIQSGRQYWSPEVTRVLLDAGKSGSLQTNELTEREMEILALLTQELNSRQIAEKLFISERTVETHRKNLLRKTNCATTIGLIKYAYLHKLI
ncbi:MAG: response regulator transcription factor [Pedobacter sp.]|nr:MAG: response regulator transcription factor [Pedobacter sp.]